jgi:CheY-like chemotaxis protein
LHHLNKYRNDFIILDFNMPKINGLELLRIIKAEKILKDIPVIMYSATMGNDLSQKAIEAGAFKCIRKPYQMAELPAILKSFL